MRKVGAITIGQAPRTDVTKDILPLLGEEVELIQAGGLDGLTREEIQAFAPGPDDYVLISRLQDGSSVIFAVIPPTPQQVAQSEAKWKEYVSEIIAIPASPYGSAEELDRAAQKVAELDVDLAVMDCIGYSAEMKARFREHSGKSVMLSRTLAARALMELLA